MQQTWSIEIFPREQYGVEGPYVFAKVLKRDCLSPNISGWDLHYQLVNDMYL